MALVSSQLSDSKCKLSRKPSTCVFENLKTEVEEAPADESDFFWLFCVIGFGSSSKRKWVSRAGFMIMALVSVVSIFEILYVLIHILVHSKFSIKYASYPVSLGWIILLTSNFLIYFYFRYKNVFDEEFTEIIQVPGATRIIRNMKRLCTGIAAGIVLFSIMILIATHYNTLQSVVFSYNDIFTYKAVAIFFRVLTYYKMFLFVVMEFYYLCFTGILCAAFNDLNTKFEDTLSSAKNTTNDETARLIHSFFLDHLRLSKKLRLLDRTYGKVCYLCVSAAPLQRKHFEYKEQE